LKTYNLWICDGGGNLITHNVSTGAITLDQTLPGSFTVTGIGGGIDIYFDAYLTASVQPEVKWTTSTDAVNYTIQIVDDSDTVLCSQSELTVTDYTFTNCPALTDGQTYKVKITSYDTALNSTSAPDFPFTVDRMPPGSFSITGITGGADVTADHWLGTSNPAVNYGSASNSTHYQIQVKDAGGGVVCTLGTQSDQTGLFDYNSEGGVSCFGLIDGLSYKAYVSAFDDGENETQASNNGFDFQVDTTPPTLTWDTQPATPTADTFADFAFSASDALSGIAQVLCQLDSGSSGACVSPYNLTGLAEGSHTLTVSALDIAGNATTKTYTWYVDLTKPLLVIDSQPPAYTNNTSVSIAFHATDASGISGFTCSTDGGAAGGCTSPFSLTLPDGLHSVIIRATDNAGNYDEKTVSFTVDMTPPVLTLTSVPADPSNSVTSGTVAFSVSDANPVSTACQIDGGSFVSCLSPNTFTGLGSGSHTATIKATDAAGNTDTQSTTWMIYNYTWMTSGWGACSVGQPSWQTGGWGACSVGQPAYTYGGWGSCSASCGGGTQSRSQTCPVVWGTQTRTVICPVVSGTQTQTVTCQRNDGTTVSDSYCDAGTQPATSQSCSRGGGTDCVGGAPANSQSCSRGGGSDCSGAQATVQSCNTQACTTWHMEPATWDPGVYCMGITNGASCNMPGYYCGAIDVGMIAHCY
jgi:hypothetical protein